MWGQVERESDSPLDPRIIPARVGTRYRVCNSGDISEDHPHACGDKISNNRCFVSSTGSSPCVWGQVPASIGARINCRIIPTRVGTRSVLCYCRSLSENHPHACGDKVDALVDNADTLGSSPRVWGQVIVVYERSHSVRIIPTRVGTSYFESKGKLNSWDHPHACGDKGRL